MKITTETPDLLVLQEERFLYRTWVLALTMSGVALILGSVREYGIQAVYRPLYGLGLMLALGSFGWFALGLPRRRVVVDRQAGLLILQWWRGFRCARQVSFPLAQVTDLRIEQRTRTAPNGLPRATYRVAIWQGDTWIPLTGRFDEDEPEARRMAHLLRHRLS
jgi:hypothetical protein